MRWHRKLKTLLPLRSIEKRNRPRPRVLLQLEELETRALLSASSATPIQPATPPAKNEVVPPSTNPGTTPNAFPMLTVTPQNVSAQATSGPPAGSYTPSQIRSTYGFDQVPSLELNGQPNTAFYNNTAGKGETIAIVDAYYDPNILSDANQFSSYFSLPQLLSPGSSGGPTLSVVGAEDVNGVLTSVPASSLPTDPTGGWPLETSLDVEWAHAMAPQANILLVEAPDESNTSMFNAVQWAASAQAANQYGNVVVVSMSWGTNEFSGETSYDSTFIPPSNHPGVAFVAASGDSGAGAIYPAASPYVLSTGGTTLGGSTSTTGGGGTGGTFGTGGFGTSFGTGFGTSFGTFFARSASTRPGGGLYAGSGSLSITPDASTGGSNPNYPGESAWLYSGGGPSSYEGYPSYQYNQTSIANAYDLPGTLYNVEVTNNFTGATNYYSARMTPDVAYNTVNYAIYDSIPSSAYGTVAGWNSVDGTSAAAPQWSAIIALADQARAAKPALSTSDVLNALYNTLGTSTDPATDPTYTSVFNDITTGSNGYAAGPGYDLATGLGTPIVNNLVPLLANASTGTTFSVTGSGYGGTSGGGFGSSSGFGGSSSFSSGGYYGFTAGNQPGGGLFAGSGSLSIAPGSQGVNSLTGQTGGGSVTPQTSASEINSLTFSLATTGVATTSTATGENNFVGNISTLAPTAPSTASAGSTSAVTSTNAPLGQANVLFGASGWKGADLSGRMNNLGLLSPQLDTLADDSSANGEDGSDRSSGDLIFPDSDSSGEDWSEREFAAPAPQDDSDAGDGGDG